jgi:hypothetical protein
VIPGSVGSSDECHCVNVATHLKGGMHTSFTNVEVDPLTLMLHFNQVRSTIGEHGEQLGEAARAVINASKNYEAASGLILSTTNESRDYTEIHIAP